MIAANPPRRVMHQALVILMGFVAFEFLFLQSYVTQALLFDLDRTNNIAEIARDLKSLGLTGTMAVTEAGRLPYYSSWDTTDLWGLNTPQFAHRLVQPKDMKALNADLVVVHWAEHEDDCAISPKAMTDLSRRTWNNMVLNVLIGLREMHYELVMVPWEDAKARAFRGIHDGQGRYDCYFVRDDFGQRGELTSLLMRHGGMPADTFSRLRDSSMGN